MISSSKKTGTLCLAALVVSIFLGCAALFQNYGTFIPDETVTRKLESYQIDPDMNYYYSGSDVYPNAIMGLKKQYELDNDLWHPLKIDPKSFRDVINDMQYKAGEYGMYLHGFVMKSPDGQILGVWYSRLSVKRIVKMGKGNKVVVYTPDLRSYDNEGEGRDESLP